VRFELPMIVAQPGPRAVEAWLPRLQLAATGPSLAELRDDLALEVMMRLERERPDAMRLYQLPPHLRLRQVEVRTVARDRARGLKRELAGRVGVLLEKWPHDDFWIATPARLAAAAFALEDPDALEGALPRRLAEWAIAHDLETLEGLTAARGERLDVLEVDADPPSILPRTVKPPPRARRREPAEAPAETQAQREERRRRRRLEARVLREVGKDLSHGAEDDTLERAFGREALVEQIAAELFDRDGVALVLVGPPGAGKTALVHEVTRRLHRRYGAAGQRRDVWRVDGGRFISGQSFVGQWEQRARDLSAELAGTGDVLFADDLASLVCAGRAGAATTNLAQLLEPALARGEISILAESTPERLARAREELPGFTSLFRVIEVPPLAAAGTLTVLLGVLRELESEAGAGRPPRLSPAALEALLDAADRFRPHEAFPGKAVRLLRRLASRPGTVDGDVRRFGVADVHALVRAETGLPELVVGGAPRTRAQIVGDLGAAIAGQPEAVAAVADVVQAMQAGLGDPDKPLATLLLVGPTGVGKTETARALARTLFGSPERLLRFDMSELSSPASLGRLFGEAGGAGGELTTALRAQPLRVILLDEIEKAHPRVFDALLQLLGEGRITDPSGHTADARQAVILMTSNLGVREAAARPGFVPAGEDSRQHYLSAVRAFFRPELFNRIDRVVPYQPLDRRALRVVVEHALAELLGRRGIRQGNVLVDVEPELLDLLVEQAFDPRYGARPLRRALERRLTVPLARHLATRRGDDLALVELFRREGDLGLAVRLLVDAPRLADPDPPPLWSVRRLAAVLEELAAELSRVQALPAAARLAEARRLALAGDGPAPPGGELLDALAAIAQRLADVDPEDLSGWRYVEALDDATLRDRAELTTSHGDHRRGHMGLRPRPGFVDLPLAPDPEATRRQIGPVLARLRDELAVVAARLEAAGARGDERLTLLHEGVGAVPGHAIYAAATLDLRKVLPGVVWIERREGGWAPLADGQALVLPQVRRMATVYEGPGLRELLAPLAGWILVDGQDVRHLVRAHLLEGGDPTARPPADDTGPGTIVARGATHVATGLPVEQHDAIAAALLRWRLTP
jgi:ATP-dependent Clp protease ATP-binding subunit ClpC